MTERNQQGMLLFVLSEAMFFGLLIGAYVFFHHAGDRGTAAANALSPLRTGLFSLALFASSATLWAAERALHGKRLSRGLAWLLATFVLGAIFLAGQGSEYLHLLHAHVTISRDLFGTTFFTLTGFHGLHVLAGLTMLAILLGLGLTGKGREPTAPATTVVAVYWHFVDAVWIVIFSVVYLWGFLT